MDNLGDGGGHGAQVNDLVTLRLDLSVPANLNCLSLDFRFLSEEFPEFVGQSVNDAFVAELDASDFTIGPTSEVIAPRNFAFDEDGNVISINTAGFSAANSAGTTYDGATSLLRASTPVTPGAHSVYLSVFDQGDSTFDSAALLDRVQLRDLPAGSCNAGASGDTIPPETSITAGPADGSTVDGAVVPFSFTSNEPGSTFECSLDGDPFETCTSPVQYADLPDGASTFAVRAFDPAGNADPTPASRSFVVGSDSGGQPLPPPVAGDSVNVELVSGVVKTKCKGGGAGALDAPENLDVGCVVDAREGRLTLTSGTGEDGETQSADFYDGVFKILQRRGSAKVTLALTGDLGCGKGGKGRGAAKRGRRGGRGLWGDGQGRFSTRGNRGAGSIRGTKWFVGDRCDGSTIVKVARGVVSFRDFAARKTVKVKAGHRYTTEPRKRR